MPRLKNLSKQNPKLLQKTLQDGRASLYLEYYLGRHETPVLDEDGNPVLYTEGAMVESLNTRLPTTARRRVLISTFGSIPKSAGTVAEPEYFWLSLRK
ncbi:hypothetical protein [Duncaniella muris]|uniref:hypothetical protein n=1 Tax=Duncaniella muris TaxID=2094150 RepID=UPI003F66337E